MIRLSAPSDGIQASDSRNEVAMSEVLPSWAEVRLTGCLSMIKVRANPRYEGAALLTASVSAVSDFSSSSDCSVKSSGKQGLKTDYGCRRRGVWVCPQLAPRRPERRFPAGTGRTRSVQPITLDFRCGSGSRIF